MNRRSRGCTGVFLALVYLAAFARAGSAPGAPAPARALLGCWQSEADPSFRILFEKERALLAYGELVQVAHVLDYGEETIRLRCWGRRAVWRAVVTDGRLALSAAGEELLLLPPGATFRRVEQPAEELARQTRPLPLPASHPLDAQRVAAIRAELEKRAVADQEVRHKPVPPGETQRVDGENTRYLRGLLQEVGWIDKERFSNEAATAAFLLVQHSPNLSLMLAALPHVERAAHQARRDGEAFALLYDRVQVRLGEKQRYGTQCRITPNGEFQVYPLQDRARVDEFRAGLGLGPLAGYLANLSAGRPVRFLEAN